MSSTLSPFVIQLARIFLLAFAYLLAGRLALLLAIPPGFATAIFPPLGISLAAILIWGNSLLFGVFLGSVLLNTSLAISSGSEFSLPVLIVSAEIALGSCLAAWVGASSIKKCIGFPNALMDEWSIFLFFVLGGPVASIVSASVGVGTLYVNGVISVSQLIDRWVTWWTGDAIGVLIAAPLVFILFSQPRALWRNRFKTVGIPLVVGCVLMVSIFINSSQREQQKIERAFNESAKEVSDKLFFGFSKHIDILTPLKGLYIASDKVLAEEFRLFTYNILTDTSDITALSWNQYVTHEERANYEQSMRKDGFTDFFISERNSSGALVAAQEHKSYVVVSCIEPYAKNKVAHGFNAASETMRSNALMLANQTGLPAMTAPIRLLQENQDDLNYLIFMPVYKTFDVPKTNVMREKNLRGYVTAFVKVKHQLEAIHTKFPKTNFLIHLNDVTDKNHPINLYDDGEPTVENIRYRWNIQQNIAGRDLALSIMPTQAYISMQLSKQSWYVLVGGLLFCGLLGGFLLLVTGRTEYISSLVEQRTLELESILDGAVEAIIIVNQRGVIERANPAACRLFKIDEPQLIEKN